MSIKPDVCLVVTLDDKDRFLVIRRSAKNSRAGNWECPLGHRDPSESPTTAAHREVDEETGLKVKLFPKTFDKKSPDGKRIRVYLARVQGKTTVTTNPTEHDAHRWVPWDQLDSIDKCHDSFRGDVAKIVKLNGTPTKEASMLNMSSQRGFMPQPLMNNQYAASFPANSALPSNPNPLSRTQPVNTTSADANGIQQAMAKRAAEKAARHMGLRAALPLLKESSSCNMHPTAAGEGDKKYKIDSAADAKGEDAFKSLDAYMKKAGLNSFQANFFGRLIQAGMGEQEIRQAVKLASDRFGKKVASELNSGIEKIAFLQVVTRALPLLQRAGSSAGRYFAPASKAVGRYFAPAAKAVAPVADDAVKAVAPVVDDAVKAVQTAAPVAQKAVSPLARAGQAVSNTASAVANSPITQQALTGAGTGLVNPHTGLMSEDPSLTGVLSSMGVGALTGGTLGKFAPNAGRTIQDIQRRAMGGAGASYAAGQIGNRYLGYDVNPSELARYGQLAGLLPGRIPRTQINTTPIVQHMDPSYLATYPLGLAGRGIAAIPGIARRNLGTIGAGAALGGIGYGGMQLPGAIERGLAGMKPDEKALADAAFQNPAVQQRLGKLDKLLAQGGQAVQSVQDTSQRANDMMGQFTGAQGNFSLSNLLGGFGGQAGQYFSQNQNWLIPLLLGGGGAALGYGLGDGGGAVLGGIGLPLIYMLMQNPQLLESFKNSPQASAAAQQAAQQNATENSRVQEFMQNPNLRLMIQRGENGITFRPLNINIPQESIIQQQQRQQALANLA